MDSELDKDMRQEGHDAQDLPPAAIERVSFGNLKAAGLLSPGMALSEQMSSV